MSDSLWLHESQHARLRCPSPTLGACSNSCPLSQWCHPAISSSVDPFSAYPQSFPASGSFPMSCIRWPKYWSFSICLSNEYSGLISLRIDWFDLPVVHRTLKKESSPASQFESVNSSGFRCCEVKWSCSSCLALCDPMDCSLAGSSIHGIFQAIVLEWVAISFSRGSSWPRDGTQVSHIVDRCFTVWATSEVRCCNGLLNMFTS